MEQLGSMYENKKELNRQRLSLSALIKIFVD